MTFNRVDQATLERDGDPHVLARWDSVPTGRYRVVIVPMIFGLRCNLMHDYGRPHGDPHTWLYYEAAYCMGDHRLSFLLVPAVVIKALAGVEEHAVPRRVGDLLPQQRRKPMYNDPDCWRKLCELAGLTDGSGDLLFDS